MCGRLSWHDLLSTRSPVVRGVRWLAADVDGEELKSLLKPYQAEQMQVRPVSRKFNVATCDSADVLDSL